MKFSTAVPFILCGALAGAVNGLFGAGGGMILIPLLTLLTDLSDRELFPTSVCMIAPQCIVTLCMVGIHEGFPWDVSVPHLLGSAIGGIAAGILAKRIPTKYLHRFLGLIVLWGGIRYLC